MAVLFTTLCPKPTSFKGRSSEPPYSRDKPDCGLRNKTACILLAGNNNFG